MILPALSPGDAIRVWWVDIAESAAFDNAIRPDVRVSPPSPGAAIFRGFHEVVIEAAGERLTLRYLLTGNDYSTVDQAYVGSCAYPVGCVVAIELVSKATKARRKPRSKVVPADGT